MNKMDIDLFSSIRGTDYALSARFSLATLENITGANFEKYGAIAKVRFYLHAPDGLHQRNYAYHFDKFGNSTENRKILNDSDTYAHIVDSNPNYQKVEKDLSEAICAIIALAVKKHFADEATEN